MKKFLAQTSTRSKFILSLTVFVLLAGLLIFSYMNLRSLEAEYQNKLELIANYSESRETVKKAEEMLLDTEEDREKINEYFLTVIKMAQFLETVEQYAIKHSLELTSHSIETNETDVEGVAQVTVPFSLRGSRSEIHNFITLMETIPYHGYVESVRVEKDLVDPRIFSAEVVVNISYIES